jgi:hypothetical protein
MPHLSAASAAKTIQSLQGIWAATLRLGLRKLATYENVRASGFDPLVVQFALCNRKYLSRPVDNRIAGLPDNKFPRNDQPTDLEMMSMPAFARARIKLLILDFIEAVGS